MRNELGIDTLALTARLHAVSARTAPERIDLAKAQAERDALAAQYIERCEAALAGYIELCEAALAKVTP